MKLSAKGEDLIIAREGQILKVYLDSEGYPTMGVGHLLTPAEKKRYPVGTKISAALSRQLFEQDVQEVENAIATYVKVPLEQNQYDALVSLVFNIGITNFKKSTVLRRLNEKDYARAANAFLLWNEPPEIRGRRSKEFAQFKKPYVVLAPDPAPAVNASAVSDQTGGGGTQTTPNDPPSVFTKEKLTSGYNTVMQGVDTVSDAQERFSRVGLGTGLTSKGSGAISLGLAFLYGNWKLVVAGLVLIALGGVILYVSYRRRKNKNGNNSGSKTEVD